MHSIYNVYYKCILPITNYIPLHSYYQHNLYYLESLTYFKIFFYNAGEALCLKVKSDCNTVRL